MSLVFGLGAARLCWGARFVSTLELIVLAPVAVAAIVMAPTPEPSAVVDQRGRALRRGHRWSRAPAVNAHIRLGEELHPARLAFALVEVEVDVGPGHGLRPRRSKASP